MSPAAEQLLQSVLALPEEEREGFIDALLAACPPPPGGSLDGAWLAEAERRSAQIDAGEVETTPWPEVLRRVRERVEKRHGG